MLPQCSQQTQLCSTDAVTLPRWMRVTLAPVEGGDGAALQAKSRGVK